MFCLIKKSSVQINEDLSHVTHGDLSKQLNEKEKSKKNRAKEHRHSEKAVRILKEWLMRNAELPYPTIKEKKQNSHC